MVYNIRIRFLLFHVVIALTTAVALAAGITVTPNPVTILPGGSRQFSDNPTSGGDEWTISPATGGGSINGTGLFTALPTATILAGTYTVTVTHGGNSGSATITVNLAVSPTAVTLAPGNSYMFSVTPPSGVTWSATGGSITSGGLYTAGGTTGTYTVTASSSDDTVYAQATVTVMTILPDPVNITPNSTQQFTATPPTGVVWSVVNGGGSISASGLFTAGTTTGTYTNTVSATVSASTGSVTATVNVALAIGIAKTADLSFGAIVASSASGTVVITPAGARYVTGGAYLPATTGTVTAASFNVSGQPNYGYAITLPTSVTLTDTEGTMTVNAFTSTPSGNGTLSGSGAQTLNVGATLTVGAGQAAGTYSGTFTVTVAYQ